MQLNQRAAALCDQLAADADRLRVAVSTAESGVRILDAGITMPGGLEAGRRLAEICLAGLGSVQFATSEVIPGPAVIVATDHPVAACMASQYAGWRSAHGKFFAMGSGPMRAAAGKEELFDTIGHREQKRRSVGVLETRKLPPAEVVATVAERLRCRGEPLDAARGADRQPGRQGADRGPQRGNDIAQAAPSWASISRRVESGWGTAPLPPVAADDLAAIGRTNDAILYGGEVTLWVRGDDDSTGRDWPARAQQRVGRSWRTVRRDLRAVQPRLLRHRSAPVQPGPRDARELDTGAFASVWHKRVSEILRTVVFRLSSCTSPFWETRTVGTSRIWPARPRPDARHRLSLVNFSNSPRPWDSARHGSRPARSSLAEVDAVLVRTMPPGSLEQVVFRMDVLARLAAAGHAW